MGAAVPLAQTTVDHRSDNHNGAGGEPHDQLRDAPTPTLSEMQVVAAAWPIYDRLIRDEDPAGFRRLSSVWAEAREIAVRSLTAAKETT